VYARDEALHVGPTEYRLLHFFMTHADRVYTARSCSTTSGAATSTSRNARWTCTSAACARRWSRPGIEDMVQTVRGSGYRFSALT
jgi:two-component system phosphate regulon response regulator PhoB